MHEIDVVRAARSRFLDGGHAYGCAETAFVVLKEAWDLEAPLDSSPAMALNGGLAYSGGPCGAISGVALAVGLLAARRIDDHGQAKAVARGLVADLMDAFVTEHGALECRALTGYDFRSPGGHEAFMASGIWRDRCMRQIEFAVTRLAPLAAEDRWAEAVRALGPAED